MATSFQAVAECWRIVLIIVERDGSLVLVVEPTRTRVPCPQCGEPSGRQHSWYERRPLDLPWRGHTVRMRVHSRRWFCDTPACPRKIFAERFGGVLARYARRTSDTTELLTTFALQAGGEGGARLARAAGVPVSPDTLLRLLHALTDAEQARGPRVLGVDDLALRRKRRRYGTVLVDLETHRAIDLLDDRTAEVFAGWLRSHPGVEIIVRDRAGAYAEGGRQGAPDAIQVADRYHLSANASAALDELLRSRRRHVEYVVVSEPAEQSGPTPTAPEPPPSQTQQNLAIQRTRRSARWDEVRNRRAAGYSIQCIAREMAMHRRTVRRYLATPAPPRNHPSERPRPSGLSSPPSSHSSSTRRVVGKPGVPTSPNSSVNWRYRAMKTAIHCSCNHSSRGGVRVRRRNLDEGGGVAGHAPSASTCAGCVSVHRANSTRWSAMHSRRSWRTMNISPLDMNCCSDFVA